MNKTSKWLKSFILASTLLPCFFLTATNHIIVGTDEDPATEIVNDFDSEEAGECKDETQSGFFFYGQTPVYYPASDHWIMHFNGSLIEIEDGSGFSCDVAEGQKVHHWNWKSPITITQNRSWFSSYKYRIFDQNTGESIPVNLTQGPLENTSDFTNTYLTCVSVINRSRSALALTNKMELDVCPQDIATFSRWHEGNAIIIGVNSGWYSAYSLLLINVDKNNFIRAKQR